MFGRFLGPIFGFRALTADNGTFRFRAKLIRYPKFKRKRVDEGSGAGKAGGRLQRQGPGQERRIGRRTVQRQDVDESVRRNRRRGSPAPERGRQGNRGRGGVDRPRPGVRNHPHRSRHGRRPRHSGQGRRQSSNRWRWRKSSRPSSTKRSPASSFSASRRSTTIPTRPARCWPPCSDGRRRPLPPSSKSTAPISR